MARPDDPANATIIAAVVLPAHGPGNSLVAEGIESATQLATLRDLDCDRAQGYWFARPLPDLALEGLPAAATGGRVRPGAQQRLAGAAGATRSRGDRTRAISPGCRRTAGAGTGTC